MLIAHDPECTYLWHPVHGWTTPVLSRLDEFKYTDHAALIIASKLQAFALTEHDVRATLRK